MCVRGVGMYMYVSVRAVGTDMYVCVRGVDFASVSRISEWNLELFRKCGISLFFIISNI